MSNLCDLIHAGVEDQVQKYLSSFDKDSAGFIKSMNERDTIRKSCIEMFAILNQKSIIEKAISCGYNLAETCPHGCNLVHYAAIWDRAELIKYLYFAGLNIYCRNKQNETPHEMATKYGQAQAAHMLEWIECRDQFSALIRQVKDILASADKSEFTKEEKKIAESACMDGESWINRNKDASLSALKTKKEQIELIVEPILRRRTP